MKSLLFTLLLLAALFTSCSSQNQKVDADDPNIYYTGRIDYSNPKAVKFAWPGVSIKAKFEGKKCIILLNNYHQGQDPFGRDMENYYNLIVDGQLKILQTVNRDNKYAVDALSDGVHTIELFKRTEGLVGYTEFKGFELENGKKLLPIERLSRKIEFVGNSITCGYGNEGSSQNCHFNPATENHYRAYAAIAARNLNAEHHAIAYSGKGLYRNFDNTTDETMPDLYDRIFPFDSTVKWNNSKWVPDVVVINLGTNDFSHIIPNKVIWVNKYLSFIKTIRKHAPNAYIFCTIGPMGSEDSLLKNYISSIVKTASANGETRIETHFYPPQTPPYGCDYHPGIETHEKMAKELTTLIKQKLNW